MRFAVIAAALCSSSCLVTDVDPTPNRNDPPRILMPGVLDSITTPPDAIFRVSASPTLGFSQYVKLSLDVVDADSTDLEYRIFVIGQEAGTSPDGGVTGFVRRFSNEATISLANGRGVVTRIVVPGDEFIPTGRCYAVEVRVSSDFRDLPTGANPELPSSDTDIASVVYWVASYGPTDTSIDLASCPIQP